MCIVPRKVNSNKLRALNFPDMRFKFDQMHTKNSTTTIIVVVSMLTLITLASSGFYFSRPQTVALAGSEAIAQPSLAKSTDVVAPQAHPQDAFSVTQDEITVNVTSAKIIDTGVEIGICYTTPDNGEWRPQPGHLFYDKGEAYPNEIEFLENEKLADGKKQWDALRSSSLPH